MLLYPYTRYNSKRKDGPVREDLFVRAVWRWQSGVLTKILSEQLSKYCANRSIHLCCTRQLTLCCLVRGLNETQSKMRQRASWVTHLWRGFCFLLLGFLKTKVFKSCVCLKHIRICSKRWKEGEITASEGKKQHYFKAFWESISAGWVTANWGKGSMNLDTSWMD